MVFRIAIFIILALIGVILYIKYYENRGIFYPTREIIFTPRDVNLDYEDVYLNTPDGLRLHGWFIDNPQATFTILFLHGNAGNIGDRLELIRLFVNAGFKVFIIDYRGYGKRTL